MRITEDSNVLFIVKCIARSKRKPPTDIGAYDLFLQALPHLFSIRPEPNRQALDLLQDSGETTVIYFSGRPRELGFTTYLHLGYDEQRLFDSFEALCAAYDDEPCSIDSPALAPA